MGFSATSPVRCLLEANTDDPHAQCDILIPVVSVVLYDVYSLDPVIVGCVNSIG